MAYNAHILLGRITKVHGYEGAVTVKLEKTFIENINDLESVFIEIDGKPVPFFIDWSDYPGGDSWRLKFTGYESPEKVAGFIGCRVYLTTGKNAPERISGQNNLSGYTINLEDDSFLGTVKEIIDNPGQSLINILSTEGKSILIPLHEDFIIDIDNKNRIIKMNLPEGLIDINR